MMKKSRSIMLILIMAFSIFSSTYAAENSWVCDVCHEMKTTNFCTTCGTINPQLSVIETETIESLSIEDIPSLDSLYGKKEVRLKTLTNKEQRVLAYYGPSKNHVSAGGYKPDKQVKVEAYFNEAGWVFIDLKYKTAQERYLFVGDNAFDSLAGVTNVSEMAYFEGITVRDTNPRLGPSTEFFFADELKNLSAGNAIKMFFQKNGFVYAEFMKGAKPVRLWIPLSDVTVTGSGNYQSVEREKVRSRSVKSFTDDCGNLITATEYTEKCPNCSGIVDVFYVEGAYAVIDEKMHFTGPYSGERCRSCDWKSFTGGDIGTQSEHEFVNGVCRFCGYEK